MLNSCFVRLLCYIVAVAYCPLSRSSIHIELSCFGYALSVSLVNTSADTLPTAHGYPSAYNRKVVTVGAAPDYFIAVGTAVFLRKFNRLGNIIGTRQDIYPDVTGHIRINGSDIFLSLRNGVKRI